MTNLPDMRGGVPAAGRPVPPTVETGPDWRRAADALWRFKWLIGLSVALGLALGVAATRVLAPEYLAQATIWIDVPKRQSGPERGPIRPGGLLESDAWIDLLKSYLVLDAVAQQRRLYLQLDEPGDSALFREFRVADRFRPGDYVLEVNPANRSYELLTADDVALEHGILGDSVGAALGFRWRPPPAALGRARRVEFAVVALRDAARRLEQALTVRMDLEGNFLRVELRGDNPTGITATLNAVVHRYVEVAAQLKREKLRELTAILEEQLRVARENLRAAEAALEAFRVRTITLPGERAPGAAASAEPGRDPVVASFFDLQVEREQVRRDREAIERLLADSAVALGTALAAVPAVARSPELSFALKELADKQAERRTLEYRYAEAYPPLQRLSADIATLERSTIPALARELVRALAAREAELGRQADATSATLRAIPPRVIEEARVRRRVALAEQLYLTLQERAAEARLAAEASSVPDIRILDAAVVPQRPVKNTAPRLLLVALVGGLGVGVMGALLLDRLDTRVRSPEQVSVDLDLPVLGVVPHLRAGGAPDPVIEALRGVGLNLLHAYGGGGPMLVTLTSPGPGDGKSFLAANLALTLAQGGRRTLLVDGDLRRGLLHRRLKASRRPGLTDFLDAPPERRVEIVQPTEHPVLDLIASGTRTHRVPELLGSPAMRELLQQIRTQYDVILVDSPPLGAGVDPFILGTLTGALVLVLRAGYSHRDQAEAKLELLRRLPVRVLGAVVNDVPPGARHGYYYSYYLPGYETSEEERPALPPASRPRVI